MKFKTYNPETGAELKTYCYATDAQIENDLRELVQSYQNWKKENLQERSQVLFAIANELRNYKQQLAKQMNIEMGKSISDGEAEVEKCVVTTEYYAENLTQFLKEDVIKTASQMAQVNLNPIGIIYAIMPWNFPCWQLIRCAIPAISVGNVVMLKHSDITAGCAELLEEVFSKATKKYTLLKNTHVNHKHAEKVIADFRVQGVSFTGSTRGGREIAAIAGKNLKKTVMELGGSDAYMVLKDADIKLAAKICAISRFINSGQSCIAAKRFFVAEEIIEEFLEQFKNELSTQKIVPLAHKKFQLQLHAQVQKCLKQKNECELLMGGVLSKGPGAYYPTTILKMKNNAKTWAEEFFGPVACVWSFKTVQEAITYANQSIYGLGGAVFSKNINQAMEVAKNIECGAVAINDMVRSDPHFPFGGVKDSGYGRELSRYGLYEFANLKTIVNINSI